MRKLEKFKRDFALRQAARTRLPIWLRLLMPVMAISAILGLTFLWMIFLWSIHRTLHPDISFAAASEKLAFPLMFFPAFLGATVPALMLLNVTLARVPPLKRIMEDNAKGVPGASYQESMRSLGKIAKFVVPPAIALSLLGAIEPWAAF